jgi:hypothetical protein
MNENIYLTGNGWIYEVWFDGRVIVVGCCATFEAATRAAADVFSAPRSAPRALASGEQ